MRVGFETAAHPTFRLAALTLGIPSCDLSNFYILTRAFFNFELLSPSLEDVILIKCPFS